MSVRIQITKPGIYDGEGKPIPVGTEITLKVEPKGWAGRYSVLSDSKGKTAATNPADAVPVGPFEAKQTSPGWFSIHDGSGAEVGKALRKDDADAFNSLSADHQAEFAAEHAKA